MKKKTPLIFMGLALVLGLVSMVLLSQVNKGNEPQTKAPVEETRELILAAAPIPAGDVLDRDDLKVVDWPKQYYPTGNVFSDKKELVGRVARRDIFPDEPIFKEKLAGDTSMGGLTVMVPAGMRAVTVKVSDVIGVAGFLKPGDRVDVLVNVEMDIEREQVQITKTLLQNVLVLASDQTMVDERLEDVPGGGAGEGEEDEARGRRKKAEAPDPKKTKPPKTITLALWPGDIERVVLAEEVGDLRLVLRPEGDTTLSYTDGANDVDDYRKPVYSALGPWLAQHSDRAGGPREQEEQPKPYSVELIQGAERQTIGLDEPY